MLDNAGKNRFLSVYKAMLNFSFIISATTREHNRTKQWNSWYVSFWIELTLLNRNSDFLKIFHWIHETWKNGLVWLIVLSYRQFSSSFAPWLWPWLNMVINNNMVTNNNMVVMINTTKEDSVVADVSFKSLDVCNVTIII